MQGAATPFTRHYGHSIISLYKLLLSIHSHLLKSNGQHDLARVDVRSSIAVLQATLLVRDDLHQTLGHQVVAFEIVVDQVRSEDTVLSSSLCQATHVEAVTGPSGATISVVVGFPDLSSLAVGQTVAHALAEEKFLGLEAGFHLLTEAALVDVSVKNNPGVVHNTGIQKPLLLIVCVTLSAARETLQSGFVVQEIQGLNVDKDAHRHNEESSNQNEQNHGEIKQEVAWDKV